MKVKKNLITIVLCLSNLIIQNVFASEYLLCRQLRPFLDLYVFLQDNGDINVQVYSSEGINSLPLYRGVVTTQNLPFINYQISDLKDFPQMHKMSWFKEDCKYVKEDFFLVFKCQGEAATEEGYPYKNYGVSTTIEKVFGIGEQHLRLIFRWPLTTESTTYFLEMVFFPEQCRWVKPDATPEG
jgi:hypothetical protein